ncbi:DUF1697 domain-containing protein [Gramella lutea]|uniref:DUF1697 domain-containing protein n=1 Tax=Christiangramia lutea TaxID=1607951 RepID=A0A9X1V670_9FLAO|nr:DUF1697 domain-containing protein [Christiangramia lutea]MCH4824406.1 DUF1697 domain-containing protein [Christiangramia lutea]
MKKIAILRGINVGGKRKILMADLKALFEKTGLENIKTYIQSGNIIFNSNSNNFELEKILENSIRERFGFNVPVIVRNSDELQNSITHNPFYNKNADINKLHLTFLKEKPSKEYLDEIQSFNYEPDNFKIDGQNVFLFIDGKYHKTKLSNTFFEKKLKVGATTRNWKTVLKLIELSKD